MDTAKTTAVKPRRAALTALRAKQIDALLLFLEPLTAPGFSAGEVIRSPGCGPEWQPSPIVEQLNAALYAQGWVDGHFNWPDWQSEAQEYIAPGRVAGADVKTIRQLFTTHVRKDRFAEGHFAQMIDRGHIVELLRRLQEIRMGARVV